jgi:hypothetical protein
MASFLNGATAMACAAIGMFFFKFWRESTDRLFLCLSAAFAIFAVNYAALGLLPRADERLAYAFVLRLIGFVAILVGIAVKDRELIEHLRVDGRNSGT